MRKPLTVSGAWWLLVICLISSATATLGRAADSSNGLKSLGITLAGVVAFEEHPRALVSMAGMSEELLVSEGDLIEGYTVRRIDKDQIELAKGDRTETLLMNNVQHLKAAGPVKTFSSAAGSDANVRMQAKRLASAELPRRVLTRGGSPSSAETGSPRFMRPIMAGYVSSPFGWRHRVQRGGYGGSSSYHRGVDVAAPYGTPVYAATDGIVAASTWSFAKGNYVEVRHAGGYSTAYYHLSEQSAGVNQRVRAGERIGRVGNTGSSTGAHLHFEIRINDTAVNPAGFIRALR